MQVHLNLALLHAVTAQAVWQGVSFRPLRLRVSGQTGCEVSCGERLSSTGSRTVQELSKEYIERQKTVDAALVKALSAELKGYLGARFTLKAGDRPHLMKF